MADVMPKREDTMVEAEEKERQEYEERLQRRLQILKKQFDEGKIKIAEGLQVIDSLKAVRYRPDGLEILERTTPLQMSQVFMPPAWPRR